MTGPSPDERCRQLWYEADVIVMAMDAVAVARSGSRSMGRCVSMSKRVFLQQRADLRFRGPALFVDGAERAGQGRCAWTTQLPDLTGSQFLQGQHPLDRPLTLLSLSTQPT